MSVDSYAVIFYQTFYSYIDVSQAKAKAIFIEEFKPNIHINIKKDHL